MSSHAQERKEETGHCDVYDMDGFNMQQYDGENASEQLESMINDEEIWTVNWDNCDDYLDTEFVLKRCRQARQIVSIPRRQDYKTNKTERKKCLAAEARIKKQAKKQKEKRLRKSDSKQPSTNNQPRQRHERKKQHQPEREDLKKSGQNLDTTRELEKHVLLIPAHHIVNRKNLANGMSQELLDLQERDLTPEDYELLLTLDDFVSPQTVPLDVIKTLVTSRISEESNEACSVCMEVYKVGQQVKMLPCCHVYHSQCIDHWLTAVSNRCPLDGKLLTGLTECEASECK
jgi:hypothetical protein